MRRRDRGFSLVELSVSLVVLMLALALATQLLFEAQLSFLRTGRSLLDPLPDLAVRQLRNDIHAARQALQGSWLWSSGPLVLEQPQGIAVRYEFIEDRLQRERLDPFGQPLGSRTLLLGVASWRWRQAAPGLLELELVVLRGPTRSGVLFTGPDQLAPEAPVPETLRLHLAPRGMLGGSGW